MSGSSLTARARARIGRTLKDKWRLVKLLGVGGTAAVYVAHHRNGKKVAVKILHPELSLDDGFKVRFLREGYAANKVRHAGAVAVLDDDVDEDGTVFLVMELLDGETLSHRWKRAGKTMPVHEVMQLADELLGVLEAAHDKQIVHRDIKPENLFLTSRGELKILDFGIARLRDASAEAHQATMTGVPMGTPGYMPPEQARGKSDDIGPRTDLWSVGATMFALLSGRKVHEADTASEQLIAAMMRPAPPLVSVAPGLPASLQEVVDRALAFDPTARWSSASEMRAAVRRAYADVVGRPLASSPRLHAPPSNDDVTGFSASPGAEWSTAGGGDAMKPWPRRVWQGARSHPTLAGLALFLVFSSVGLGVVFVRAGRHAPREPEAIPTATPYPSSATPLVVGAAADSSLRKTSPGPSPVNPDVLPTTSTSTATPTSTAVRKPPRPGRHTTTPTSDDPGDIRK